MVSKWVITHKSKNAEILGGISWGGYHLDVPLEVRINW